MKHNLLTCILLCGTMLTACAQQKEADAYQAIVAQDGSGDYTNVQAAIDAAPDSCLQPWRIFVKNGSYEEQVIVPQSKPYIHLIGQDKDSTVIHMRLNVGGKPEKPEDDPSGYWHVRCTIRMPRLISMKVLSFWSKATISIPKTFPTLMTMAQKRTMVRKRWQ